jgi:hypothetical protein
MILFSVGELLLAKKVANKLQLINKVILLLILPKNKAIKLLAASCKDCRKSLFKFINNKIKDKMKKEHQA